MAVIQLSDYADDGHKAFDTGLLKSRMPQRNGVPGFAKIAAILAVIVAINILAGSALSGNLDGTPAGVMVAYVIGGIVGLLSAAVPVLVKSQT